MQEKIPAELIDQVRTEFFTRLERKTGWGKEELKIEFERALGDAFIKYMEKLAKQAEELAE